MRPQFIFAVLLAFTLSACANSGPPATRPTRKVVQTQPDAGQPVNGLRLRLICANRTFRAPESISPVLEFENVGKQTLVLTPPFLLPVIGPAGVNKDVDCPCTTIISAERRSSGSVDLDRLKMAIDIQGQPDIELRPGDKFVLAVSIASVPYMIEPDPLVVSPTTDPKLPRIFRQRESAYFLYADFPGTYRLQAAYEIKQSDKGAWTGKVFSNFVDITISKPAAATRPVTNKTLKEM